MKTLTLTGICLIQFLFLSLHSQNLVQQNRSTYWFVSSQIQPVVVWSPKNELSSTLEYPNIKVRNTEFIYSGIGLGFGKKLQANALGAKLDFGVSQWKFGFWWTGVPNVDGTGKFPLVYPYSRPPGTNQNSKKYPPHDYILQTKQFNPGVFYHFNLKKITIQASGGISFQFHRYTHEANDLFAKWNNYAMMPSEQGDTVFFGYIENIQPESRRKMNVMAFGELTVEIKIDKEGLFRPFAGLYYQKKIFPAEPTGKKIFHFSRYPYWNLEIGTTTWKGNMERVSLEAGIKIQLPINKRK